MWDFLAKQILKQAGKKIGNSFFSDDANAPEVYADRIKRDFKLDDYAEAWSLYDSDPAYWERYYRELPRPDWKNDVIMNSAAAAGVPSRNNVFEYGFPESGPIRSSDSEVLPVRKLSTRHVRPGGMVASESLADPMSGRGVTPDDGSDGRLSPSHAFDTGTSSIQHLSDVSQRAPRGLPALLADAGASDDLSQSTSRAGGLPGLIQDYLRNNSTFYR